MKAHVAEPRALRIFIVENHLDTLNYFKLYLQGTGYTVFFAQTLNEARAALPAARCDVLITDIGLPDGYGWELLEDGKLSSPVYAIAMSGFGTNADRARSKAAGFRYHLTKPFDPALLDAMLDEAQGELQRRSPE